MPTTSPVAVTSSSPSIALAAGDPEVAEPRAAVLVEEDVRGLHVPVDEPGGVHGRQRAGDIGPNRHDRRGEDIGPARSRSESEPPAR